MLVLLGGGIADARGSLGGMVFSRNASGNYARNKTKPVNPNSPRQSAIRAILSEVSAKWGDSATSGQRLDWETFASNVPAKNALGQSINLSGFNQFTKSNIAGQNAGLLMYLDGPAEFTLPAQDVDMVATASEADQELSVTFDDTRDWVDEDNAGMIVRMGIPQDPTINFFDGPWRHAGTIEGDSVAAPTTPTTIAVPWPVVENQKLFVEARIIRADGRLSDWFRDDIICGA